MDRIFGRSEKSPILDIGKNKIHAPNIIHCPHGQGLLEFALILPVIILIIAGVFDLGRVFFVTITIQNAAREGARYALTRYGFPGMTPTQVSDAAIAHTVAESSDSGVSISAGNVAVGCPTTMATCARGVAIRTTVTYTFTPIFGQILPTTISLVRFAEFRIP